MLRILFSFAKLMLPRPFPQRSAGWVRRACSKRSFGASLFVVWLGVGGRFHYDAGGSPRLEYQWHFKRLELRSSSQASSQAPE